jgi:ATP-dependent Lon protease
MAGAKKNGIKHVLIPKENIKDIEKIKERNELLLDDTFKYSIIETFDDVIKYTLID